MLRITRLALFAAILLTLWVIALNCATTSVPYTLTLAVSVYFVDIDLAWALAETVASPMPTCAPTSQAPALAVVAFGVYLLISLVVGVATFKTVPEEAELLRQDILRAKKDLARRGII
jgi:hypothetical protein